jgi:hypothetical protein
MKETVIEETKILVGTEEDLLGGLKEMPGIDSEVCTRRVGGLLKDQHFHHLDTKTVEYYWRAAKRRKHLLTLHTVSGGHSVVSVLPPEKFDIASHKIRPQYQMDWLGSHLKPKHMYVFGTKEALNVLLPEGEPHGGRTESKRPTKKPRRKTAKAGGKPKDSGSKHKKPSE